MRKPVKHAKLCKSSFPRCPCNTCARDVIDDDGAVCCTGKKKCAAEQCPDYIQEEV